MILESFEKMNMKSTKVRQFIFLLGGLALAYVAGFIAFLTLSLIGESYPQTWERLTQLLNGMSFRFSLAQAGPLLNRSLLFFFLSFLLGVLFWLLGWHILRTGILATALLSLAYLTCAVLLLLLQNPNAHALTLTLIAILFALTFIFQSNILIYLRDRTYADAFLESLVAGAFILFIWRMVLMALTGGES